MQYRLPPILAVIAFIIAMGGLFLFLQHFPKSPTLLPDIPTEDSNFYAGITTSTPQSFLTNSSSRGIWLPILVYHIVRPSYPSDNAAVRAIAVTPEIFNTEMDYLEKAGYHVVRFNNLEAYFMSGTPLPHKPVILSFDDGWSDQFTYAFPILEKYHYPATFFVFTNEVGYRGGLTWDNLRELVASGMTIGDHTRSHPFLTRITSTSTLWNEIDGSKLLLERELNVPINEFAYPFGQYNPTIISLVKKAGYKSARGDFYSGKQSLDRLFTLSALNAPITTAIFKKDFP